MTEYVDIFVVPVPKKNVEAYRKFSKTIGKICRAHGALEYIVCIADDVQPGKTTSFPQAVECEPDETVVVGWLTYKSREHRDLVNAAVMKEPEIEKMMDPKTMPFDGKRMFMGGFDVLIQV